MRGFWQVDLSVHSEAFDSCGLSQALSVYFFTVYILIHQGIRSLFWGEKGKRRASNPRSLFVCLFVLKRLGGSVPPAQTHNPSSLVVGAGKLGVQGLELDSRTQVKTTQQ